MQGFPKMPISKQTSNFNQMNAKTMENEYFFDLFSSNDRKFNDSFGSKQPKHDNLAYCHTLASSPSN